MKKKRPDSVVYDEENGYNSNILPYGTNVGAPAIKMEDISTWKSISVNKVNKQLSSKFNELKQEYQKLVEEYKWNDLVYKSKFNFEPVIGDTYHLYDDGKGDIFLSLITELVQVFYCVLMALICEWHHVLHEFPLFH